MELSWTTDQRDGVTLVAGRLRNPTAIARRVRVANELDGPVLPPRRHGEPLPGWDADGVTLRVEPEGTAAIGYAVPAPAAEPPPTVAADEPARDDGEIAAGAGPGTPETAADRDPTAADAVRTLGAYRPPRDAITELDPDQCQSKPLTPGPSVEESSDGDVDVASDGATGPEGPSNDDTDAAPPATVPTASPADPAAVDAWLDAVERRVERAERLDGADVATATEVVAAAGGLDAVHELDGKVGDDAERLRTVAERAAALADRAAAAEVPTEPLRRLA